jgi:hypothetical protein
MCGVDLLPLKEFLMRSIAAVILMLLASTTIVFAGKASSEELKVKIGTSKTAKTGKISIKFVEVIEDSRCPEDANCIWAGNAKIKVTVSRNGRDRQTFELNTSLPNDNSGDHFISYNGLKITLIGLTPFPSASKAIDTKAYESTFVIERSRPLVTPSHK